MRPVTPILFFVTILTTSFVLSGCFDSDVPQETFPSPVATPTLAVSGGRTDPWVQIDSKTEQLTVYRHGSPVATFGNVAFGAAGVREKDRRGDDVTPKGKFTIGTITRASKFRIFIGLNYPSTPDAERGLQRGLISKFDFERIKRANERGETPPQNTALGGLIGIHGVGMGSPEIHRMANWTAGCIALENDQIEKLAPLIHRGVMVEIR